MRLPRDYRGLPRPSSAPCAKASAVRPVYLRGPWPLRLPIMKCSLEKSLPLRAMRLSGCPACDSVRATGAGRCGDEGVFCSIWTLWLRLFSYLPRKEVIQPHLPVRLPCYDFTPLAPHTFGASPLSVGPATSGADDSGGVTGGVYKARERIHRGVLIRDY